MKETRRSRFKKSERLELILECINTRNKRLKQKLENTEQKLEDLNQTVKKLSKNKINRLELEKVFCYFQTLICIFDTPD